MKVEEIYKELPNLETNRLFLRKLTKEDAPDIFSYASDPVVTKYLFWNSHQTLDDTMDYINFALHQYTNYDVAPWGIHHKQDNKLIGTIDFVRWIPEDRLAEIGYVIAPAYWGKGIITEAAQKIILFGFNNMNLIRVEAKCYKENVGSQRVMEKCGMSLEGTIRKGVFKKGRHWDITLYSILRDEFFNSSPQETEGKVTL